MKPTVSLCMIVRNEEANLSHCLNLAGGLVDEIVVVDTGSTDRTKQLALGFGARVFDYPWRDHFGDARNESRKHATGEWIFWLDADDRIEEVNRQRLGTLFARLRASERPADAAYEMTCRSRYRGIADVCMPQVRLFPNHQGLVWARRVHESLVSTQPGYAPPVRATDIVIDHVGYVDPAAFWRKQERDARLLQMDYAANPDDATTLFYLGRAYLTFGRLPEALRCLQMSLRCEGYSWEAKAYVLTAQCLRDLGRPSEALEAADAGLALYADDAELRMLRRSMCPASTRRNDRAAMQASASEVLVGTGHPQFVVATSESGMEVCGGNTSGTRGFAAGAGAAGAFASSR